MAGHKDHESKNANTKPKESKFRTTRSQIEKGTHREIYRGEIDNLIKDQDKYGNYIISVKTNKNADDYAVLLIGKPYKNSPKYVLATTDGYKLVWPKFVPTNDQLPQGEDVGADIKGYYKPRPWKMENEIKRVTEAVSSGKEKFGSSNKFSYFKGKLYFWEKDEKTNKPKPSELQMQEIKPGELSILNTTIMNSIIDAASLRKKEKYKIEVAQKAVETVANAKKEITIVTKRDLHKAA